MYLGNFKGQPRGEDQAGRAEVKVEESFQTPLRGVQQGKPALKGQGSCSGPRSQWVAELDGPPGGLVHLFLKCRQPGAPVLGGTTAGLSPVFRMPTLEERGPPWEGGLCSPRSQAVLRGRCFVSVRATWRAHRCADLTVGVQLCVCTWVHVLLS